jgi:NAD(P)-dependent dehydrogenase (short-subunit alcohol dehydrogenase family)
LDRFWNNPMSTDGRNRWTQEDIPELNDKIAIVTGANSGIGFEVARHLSRKGATVIMGCHDLGRGENAKQMILNENPRARLVLMEVDLSSLDSIGTFATKAQEEYDHVNLLINNAGAAFSRFSRTKDGFEVNFGVNHLGHFALTGLLLPSITKVGDSRIVTVTSTNRGGRMDFDDINCEKRKYNAVRDNLYGRSKLACLMFAIELDDRLRKNDYSTTSLAAHPGLSRTGFYRRTSGLFGEILFEGIFRFLTMSAEDGSRPVLYAATSPEAKGGSLYGPDGWGQTKGFPREIDLTGKSDAEKLAKEDRLRLWESSEEMTRIEYL